MHNKFMMQLRQITKFGYKIRGLARIAEMIRKYYSQDSRNIIINDFDKNLVFHCSLNEHMGSQIFWRGFYSGGQLKILDNLLQPEMTFVDIGANQGEFTVFAAKRLTKGQVISFEPVSTVFKKLELNIKANNFKNVKLIQKGLGSQKGFFTVYSSGEESKDGTLNEGLYTIHSTIKRNEVYETIEIICFDDFIEEQNINKIDVMKIDIEGAELEALKGAKKTIESSKPIIIMEVNEETSRAAGYSAKELIDYLGNMGYRFELIISNGKSKPISSQEIGRFQNIACFPEK